MGKSVGFIGNFKGKLGNAVGFKVSQSNSGTNQGVRVYQPNIKNPKSAAQAEQRAKYAPIFATYRALKMIIDRGNESKPYGNASRIAWLKKAFRAEHMPWYPKGTNPVIPVCCQLTFGSLQSIVYEETPDYLQIIFDSVQSVVDIHTIGDVSQYLLNGYSWLRKGDQITLISTTWLESNMWANIYSFIIDPNSDENTEDWNAHASFLEFNRFGSDEPVAVVVSREGEHGEHLRSNSYLKYRNSWYTHAPFDDASKQSAIASYMATDSANADWAEESIQ